MTKFEMRLLNFITFHLECRKKKNESNNKFNKFKFVIE